MRIEILILGRDKRLLHKVRDFFGWREQTALCREFIDDLPFVGINPADRLGLITRKRFICRQVLAIHVEHAAKCQRAHDKAHGQQGENPADERENEAQHV